MHFVVRALHSFLDYSEFQALFDMYQTVFLSNIKHDRPALIKESAAFKKPTILNWAGKEKIEYDHKNIYVFSNNKQMSQEVLVRLHGHKPEKHKVHGENIT